MEIINIKEDFEGRDLDVRIFDLSRGEKVIYEGKLANVPKKMDDYVVEPWGFGTEDLDGYTIIDVYPVENGWFCNSHTSDIGYFSEDEIDKMTRIA